jgi:hypothetical protein
MSKQFYANMNWWCIDEMPSNDYLIPLEFLKAKELWHIDHQKNFTKVINLVQPFLKSLFILENIINYDDLFENNELLEIPAYKIVLTDVNFDSGLLPTCRSEAYFKINVKEKFDSIDLSQWQLENSSFTDAVSFSWDLKITDFDSSFSSHLGVECIPIQD